MKALRNTLLAAALAATAHLAAADTTFEFGKLTDTEVSAACSRVLYHSGKLAIGASLKSENTSKAQEYQTAGADIIHMGTTVAVHALDAKLGEERIVALGEQALGVEGEELFQRFEFCMKQAVRTHFTLTAEQQDRAKRAAIALVAKALEDGDDEEAADEE